MLRIDRVGRTLQPLPSVEIHEANLAERGDIQQMICRSPNEFFAEIGEKLLLVGQEIRPAEFVGDRIDVLALDREGSAVVIELKRSNHKLHLLQALAYAGMISKWDERQFAEELARSRRITPEEAEEEIEDFILQDAGKLNENQRVVLVSGAFDYEVLVAAEWLTEKHGVDVRCYRLGLSRDGESEYLACSCIYPPRELTDHAVRRLPAGPGRRPRHTNWDDALATIRNEALVAFYKKEIGAGRDSYLRKKILHFLVQGRRRYWMSAKKRHAYVWQTGRFDGDVAFWQERLSLRERVEPVKRDRHLRFYLVTEEDFSAFTAAVPVIESGMNWGAWSDETEDPESSDDED